MLKRFELAPRLFSLWSDIPDEELMALASRGSKHPEVLEQKSRMLKDSKRISGVKFCRPMALFENLDTVDPNLRLPDFDDNLKSVDAKETEMLLKYHF